MTNKMPMPDEANHASGDETMSSDACYVPQHVIPDAESMGNLWNDRRQSTLPFTRPERRTGSDRRLEAARRTEPSSTKRGTSMRYSVAKSGKLHSMILLAGDGAALGLSFLIAFMLFVLVESDITWREVLGMSQSAIFLADYLRLLQFVLASGVAISVFWLYGHYSQRRPFWDEFHNTTKLILIFACVEATLIFISGRQLPRMWVLGTWGIAIFLIPLSRYMIRRVLMNLGLWSRQIGRASCRERVCT